MTRLRSVLTLPGNDQLHRVAERRRRSSPARCRVAGRRVEDWSCPGTSAPRARAILDHLEGRPVLHRATRVEALELGKQAHVRGTQSRTCRSSTPGASCPLGRAPRGRRPTLAGERGSLGAARRTTWWRGPASAPPAIAGTIAARRRLQRRGQVIRNGCPRRSRRCSRSAAPDRLVTERSFIPDSADRGRPPAGDGVPLARPPRTRRILAQRGRDLDLHLMTRPPFSASAVRRRSPGGAGDAP